MRYITITMLFISSLAMAQRPYLFPTIADAASNTYIGIGAYVQTQGYNTSGDGGGALYRMTAIGSAPMAADSGYVYPVTAGKVLVQVLEDEYLRTATYGVVCGSSAEATNNFNRLQRFFNAIDTLDKQAFVNGCNDTIYVNFTSALTTTLTSHDKFVMRGEGSDVTRIKATTGSIDFGFSDAAKVSLFDLYLDGYDATAFGGIGGADQSLTYVNDTLTISGGNYVVITGGGGGGTDDQTISIDSNAFKYTLSIEDGNSVTFAKVTDTDTDDQTLSFSSPNLSISEGNSVDLSALQDGTGTDDQTLTLDSVSGTYNLTIESGNTVKIKRDTDTDDQTLSVDSTSYKYTITIADGNAIDFGKSQDNSATNELQTIALDSVSGTYNLALSNGGGSVKIKRDTDTDDQTLSIDSNATTYTLTIVDGNNVKFAKGGGGGGSPGGTHNDLQINRSGSFTGTDSLEWVGAGGYLKLTGRIDQTFNGTSAALGANALVNSTSTNGNTALGNAALQFNTTGNFNTAVGYLALQDNTIRSSSTAIGYAAAANYTGFGFITAVGTQAGFNANGGNSWFAMGYQAGYESTGTNWAAIGSSSGRDHSSGSNWVALGSSAARYADIGSDFVAIGYLSGSYVGSGTSNQLQRTDNSVYLGSESRAGADTVTNEIVIGYNAIGNGSNTASYGNTSITNHYFNGTVRSSGAYIGRVTTFNSTPSQTTFGAYICHVDYTTTGAFSLVIDTDNLVSGYTLIIKDVDGNAGANNITISTEGAETIDGSSTYVISTNYGSVQLYSDGVNWYTY